MLLVTADDDSLLDDRSERPFELTLRNKTICH